MIDSLKFAYLMDQFIPFEEKPKIAVALSGGRDSLLLTILASNWAKKIGGSVIAIMVNHGLRPEAIDEINKTKEWLKHYEIDVSVLSLPKNQKHNEEEWRKARYEFLINYAKEQNILHLMVGHHYQDQIETMIMRKKRSETGLGLAGISKQVYVESLRIIRPFLYIDRDEITKTLQLLRQNWIEDKSNYDKKYERVKIRENEYTNLEKQEQENFYKKRIKIEKELLKHMANNITEILETGLIKLKKEDSEINILALRRVIMVVGGLYYPPSMSSVQKIHKNGQGTIGNSVIKLHNNEFIVERENRNLPLKIKFNGELYWDNRFKLVGNGTVIAGKNNYPECLEGEFKIYFAPTNPLFSCLFL